MGQYHKVCNIGKHEFLNPHRFGSGLKLMEFGRDADGVLTGLAVLLAATNGPGGRGGGDWHPWLGGPGYEGREVNVSKTEADRLAREIPGRWAGDRIAIIGDYAEEGDPGIDPADTPYSNPEAWTDISDDVVAAIELDYYIKEARAGVKPW